MNEASSIGSQPGFQQFDFPSPPLKELEKAYSNEYLPNEILAHLFSYLDGKGLFKSMQVCKIWKEVIVDPLFWKGRIPERLWKNFDTSWLESGFVDWIDDRAKNIPVSFLPDMKLNYNFLSFAITQDNRLFEISNLKESNKISVRDMATNENIFTHTMRGSIVEIKLDNSKLFALDDEGRVIYPDLNKLHDDNPPVLKNIQICNQKIEEKLEYVLTPLNILIFSRETSDVVGEIPNRNSKIVKIETTPNHIICQHKPCHGDVRAISKLGHSEMILSHFNNLIYHSICSVVGPYVIVTNNAHQVFIWQETKNGFISLPLPTTVNRNLKCPEVSGWGKTASIKNAPNTPLVKCYKSWVLYCYEGELSVWNIQTSILLAQVKHPVAEVIDFCTNGSQLFIYGKNGESVLYDFRC